MKTETLQKANGLQEEIKNLVTHINFVKEVKANGDYNSIVLVPFQRSNYSIRELKTKLLPISVQDYSELYLSKAEAEFKRLQIEFDELKD